MNRSTRRSARWGVRSVGRARVGLVLSAMGLWACAEAPSDPGEPADPNDPVPTDGLSVPDGFEISVFAEGVDRVRTLRFGPDGWLYAAQSIPGVVVRLDPNAAGVPTPEVVAEGLQRPFGLAFRDGYLYVGERHRIVRMPLSGGGATEVVVPDLPSSGHWTREIDFGPDGRLYLSIGSSCNLCEESDPRRAAITRYEADGSGETVIATGLRNVVGLAWHPTTGELWVTQNERDNAGDDIPPDEINIVVEGEDYGWPFCWGDRIPNQEYQGVADCSGTLPPALEIQAHSAPLGMVFYTGNQFPAEYRGDAFVALHGSWNRSEPTGYKVIHVEVEDGRPTEYRDFATGWLVGRRVTGRPVYPALGPDGSLYVSDDESGIIYRIRYVGNE